MGNNKYKVLIIEDDRKISSFIETLLETNGYSALCAGKCAQGLLLFASHMPDLVILDLGLPDRDGLEFIREIRKNSVAPIIVLSARTTENDKIQALDLGANDYVTKPFSTGELLARVRAVLRTTRHGTQMSAVPGGVFRLGELIIDYDKRLVTVSDSTVDFTQTEYNILALLSEHAGKMMTYTSIIRGIWGSCDSGSVKKLQVNMANIRKKLGTKPGEYAYIVNELGVGYRMLNEDDM